MQSSNALGVIDIRRIEVYPTSLPQTTDLVSNAANATSTRPAVYVRVLGADGEEGWGEGRALAEPSYTPESSDALVQAVVQYCAQPLLARNAITAYEVRTTLDKPVKGWHMTKAALEQAALDALLRRNNVSLVSFLEGQRRLIPAGAAVGFPKSQDEQGRQEFVTEVQQRFAEGYKRVRLKVSKQHAGNDWTLAPLQLLRNAGVDGILQPDGNMGYTIDDIDLITSTRDLGVDIFEQPFNERPFADHRSLRNKRTVRVGADESISSYGEFVDGFAGDARAFDVLAAKWCRNGGILETARIIERCVSEGIPVSIGGMIGLGTHVDLALASMITDELDTIGDHGPSGKWIAEDADPAPPLAWAKPGFIEVDDKPGVVDIDLEKVLRHLRSPSYAIESSGVSVIAQPRARHVDPGSTT